MKKELISYLDDKITPCLAELRRALADPAEEEHLRLITEKLAFNQTEEGNLSPSSEDYADPLFDAYYLYRYGYAYAFEYAVMYDAILRGHNWSESPIFGVNCMGCGSAIDAWSLAYAAAAIREGGAPHSLPEDLSFRYFGFDLSRWGCYFAGPSAPESPVHGAGFPADKPPRVCEFDETGKGSDIVDVFDKCAFPVPNYNVITFAKILNELNKAKAGPDSSKQTAGVPDSGEPDVTVFDKMVAAIERAAKSGKFNRDEYYICISHSLSSLDGPDGGQIREFASRIVNAINHDGRYFVNGRIMEQSPLFGKKDEHFQRIGLSEWHQPDAPKDGLHSFYVFDHVNYWGAEKVDVLDPDFAGINRADSLYKNSALYSSKNQPNERFPNSRSPMLRASQFCMQVIKLTRKDKA